MTGAISYVEKAKYLATKLHEGQKRWSGEPFITHPEAVAAAVREYGPDYEAAAWLHDVIEDCGATPQSLEAAGIAAGTILDVLILTKLESESYLDYILRVRNYRTTRRIKIEDIRHNLASSEGMKNKQSIRDKWQLALWILEQQ